MTNATDIASQLETCPCGSNSLYNDCCGKYISGAELPSTPEALMRSRYTAYTIADINYVFDTMKEEALKDADRVESAKWAKNSKWLGLQILNASDVTDASKQGEVEFIASYELNNRRHDLKELSKFKKINNRWYYVGSVYEKENLQQELEPIKTVRVTKIGRNDPCNCGSGKKYKKCCLS